MSEKEPTVEKLIEFIDAIIERPKSITDFAWSWNLKAIRRRLIEKPKVSREVIQKHFPCECIPAYRDRGLTMPGCLYHDTDWEELLTVRDGVMEIIKCERCGKEMGECDSFVAEDSYDILCAECYYSGQNS